MTLLERAREALQAPPTHTELVLRLRAVVKEALASGVTREAVLADLGGAPPRPGRRRARDRDVHRSCAHGPSPSL